AASKDYVETPLSELDPQVVDAVNKQYAPAIQTAIAKTVGVAGVGGLLQQVQVTAGPPGDPNGGGAPPGGGGCCSTNRFLPPWDGLYTEGDFGARAIAPGAFTQLSPGVRSAIAFAPHRLQQSGHLVSVAAPGPSSELVAVTLDTSWVIGLSGLGYAHVWLGLDMFVTRPDGTVVCRASHLEQDNQWTWAGGFLHLSDHRPGPTVTRSCRFERVSGDPTTYSVNVSASVDGTFIGFSGGYGDYFVNLGPIDVTSCALQ
ncbi:MAG TPA: hypothetical protein VFB81_10945, partial [Myxococcales bacterium]|nr:hypothetical protein [Myxococcales bacterium]